MASSSNSASASASTSMADGNHFDVFLNHRGPDVKETFATDLYNRLKKHRFQVFLDKAEMKKGEKLTSQIVGAIRTASVHIAIFSINYAHSKWCLDELVLMLKSKTTILPIFFGVKPSELRWTEGEKGEKEGGKGVYAQALRSLQNKKRKRDSLHPRYDSKAIGKWKKALYDVAEISGFELEAYNGDKEKLLADVVERVLEIIPKPLLYVSKYPTGLDDKVTDFEKTVLLHTEQESGKARVVGIVGLGGVGKSTLAKEFYNRFRKNYRRSCFLSDVRENRDRKGSLRSLQSILIKDLTQRGVEINNTDEGISYLKKHLSTVSLALIILDDVDHLHQLEALLSPAKDALGSSSLIIVTSRDKGLLTRWGIEDLFIYKLEGLNPQHSTELFCSHAFHQPCPVSGFEQVVNEFLQDACSGLPLSLKVIGALLYGEKNLEHWKSQLRKISKIAPKDIRERLRISYDSLDDEEKQMFLDIACFFIGEDEDTAIRIWDGSGWQGSLGFQNLRQKSLVEVEVINMKDQDDVFRRRRWSTKDVSVIRMHDQLRDLGRYLARERRIWRVTDNLLDQSHVRGIKNVEERNRLVNELKLSAPVFYSVSGVSYSARSHSGIFVESVFSVGQSPQLILLRCNNCLYSSLASKILVENLRVLYIEGLRSNEVVERLWDEFEAPLQLRELHIAAYGFRLPKIPESITQLKHLEKIIIIGNPGHSLETFPDEFCQLRSLKHLELRSCRSIKSLPDSFGNLTSLQYLDLSGWDRLEILPNSFGKLTKLQHIDLTYCTELQMLPNSFGNLVQLRSLCLTACVKLTISEETLGNINSLQRLDLSGCENIKVVPPQLTEQLDLRELYLGYGFKKLPWSIRKLCNLKIVSLQSSCLGMLPPSFGSLKSLEVLKLISCPWKCLPDAIGILTQLKTLIILSMHNLELLELKQCPSRELTCKNVGGEFDSRGQGALSKLDASGVSYSNVAFPNLQHLRIQFCDSLVEVGALPTTLTDLRIGSCNRLRKISGLCTLSKLQKLYINHCIELKELPSLETLVSLEFLSTEGCRKLKRIRRLWRLTKLQIICGFRNHGGNLDL